MFRTVLRRVREWWRIEDDAERFEGSGEAILDPAYNGRYRAERALERLSEAAEAADEDDRRR